MPRNTILIVEDDADLALALSVRLQSEGYRVARAPDALMALSMVRSQEPDLVILDLGLPAGGGLMFLERLRALANLPFIPVIVLTARDETARDPAMAAGAQAFLQKPADNEVLLGEIRRLLGRDPVNQA